MTDGSADPKIVRMPGGKFPETESVASDYLDPASEKKFRLKPPQDRAADLQAALTEAIAVLDAVATDFTELCCAIDDRIPLGYWPLELRFRLERLCERLAVPKPWTDR